MSSPNMRRACPTQAYGLTTMPGSRRSSYIDPIDQSAMLEERYRQLEAGRQRERQRGAGLCAHLNRHGCGLGATKSEFGLCSPCSYFCSHSNSDPRTANTDTTNMTYEESAVLDLALARKIMFCDADIEPTTPGIVEAAAAAAAVAEAAERQAAAHARLQEEMNARDRARGTPTDNKDEEMEDAPEAEPSRGPAPQKGPSQRGYAQKGPAQRRTSTGGTHQRPQREVQRPRSEADMLRDPEIMAYLCAVNCGPQRPHPPPIALIAARARAQQEHDIARRAEAAEQERQARQERLRQRQREQHRIQYEKHQQRQLQKQQELEAQEEASQADLTEEERAERKRKMREEREEQAKQQLMRLQQAGLEQTQRQQARLQQERLQRQQQLLQKQQLREDVGNVENGKGKAPQMVKLEHREQQQMLPQRQPLPVATRGE
ncbi:hypothetical protein F503_03634 [Ophiostoma piceae UAMH 11346]|uniref:Uncharacterized protein n=1 Tax=Ophiostoma piceae (strain UAMH 11346) TaxID=1262450 RepID=S3BVJ0_OPHP1|nr:hypothetical protein F503_03634 [Ophiostoma piceae UAMH 11346]